MKDLDEYAEDNQVHRGPGAWLESIPEWPQIVEGYRKGIPGPTIRKWLIEECGYPESVVTYGKFQHLYKTQARARS